MNIKTLLFGAALAASTVAIAEDNADLPIYVDYPVGEWDMRGTASIDQAYTAQRHSFDKSVFVSMPPGTEFIIQHLGDGQEGGNIAALEFWVCGMGTSGRDFNIQATTLRNYFGCTPLRLSRYSSASFTRWKKIRIPLADLDVLPTERIWNLRFTAISGSGTQTFCLDDIRLVKPAPTGITFIDVTPSSPIKVFTKEMFGATTFAYDYFLRTQETADRVSEAGISYLSFPGGGNADMYDWRNNCRRPTGEVAPVDTLGYLQFADAIGATKLICVNYGSGTPQEAADWVRYANIQHNGNVMYWSIGNECFYNTETDFRQGIYRHDAETYAAFVRDCIVQMKAVDPRIKIGIVGLTTGFECTQRTTVINPRTGAAENGWSPVVLSRLREWGTMPDYYDCHWYPITPGKEDDSLLMQKSSLLAKQMSVLRPMLTDYLGATGSTIPIQLTETNGPWGSPGKQTTAITSAVYLADFWGSCSAAGIDSFVWFCIHGPTETDGNFSSCLTGSRLFGSYGLLSVGYPAGLADPLNTRNPTFYALKAIKLFARPGDAMVQVSTNNELVSAFASVAATTGKIRLLVMNRAANKDLTVMVRIPGYVTPDRGVKYCYSAQEEAARSDLTRTTPKLYTITSGGVSTFQLSVVRYSVNVIEL